MGTVLVRCCQANQSPYDAAAVGAAADSTGAFAPALLCRPVSSYYFRCCCPATTIPLMQSGTVILPQLLGRSSFRNEIRSLQLLTLLPSDKNFPLLKLKLQACATIKSFPSGYYPSRNCQQRPHTDIPTALPVPTLFRSSHALVMSLR